MSIQSLFDAAFNYITTSFLNFVSVYLLGFFIVSLFSIVQIKITKEQMTTREIVNLSALSWLTIFIYLYWLTFNLFSYIFGLTINLLGYIATQFVECLKTLFGLDSK